MKNKIGIGLISTFTVVAVTSIQLPAHAIRLMGTFDWVVEMSINKGTASFMIEKDPFEGGMITFMPTMGAGTGREIDFNIDSVEFGNNWVLEELNFSSPLGDGSINFTTEMGSAEGLPVIGDPGFNISNLETKHVPEPRFTLSLLALSVLGVGSTLLRRTLLTRQRTGRIG